MENMLTAICVELNNYFTDPQDIYRGRFAVENGFLDAPFLQAGQFFRVVGSVHNDGVYRYPAPELQDESFDGAIFAMKVPPLVLQVVDDIAKKEPDTANAVNPYTSESFGGYSYTRATDSNGVPLSDIRLIVKQRLGKWRKMP